jgi:hypothetical protein
MGYLRLGIRNPEMLRRKVAAGHSGVKKTAPDCHRGLVFFTLAAAVQRRTPYAIRNRIGATATERWYGEGYCR